MNYIRFKSKIESICSNKMFEIIVISIIIISAISVGARTYAISPYLLSVLTTLDYYINIFFLIELLLRVASIGGIKRFFRSGWNVFDAIVVIVSLVPIEGSSVAIVARLIRVFRILRMITIIPELRVLINSLLRVLPKLGYVGLLMFVIFYIYAAIGSSFFKEVNSYLWGDISISMLTLFRIMTFEDWADVMYETMEVYPISWVYYLSFIFLTAFAFLNMIIGVIVSGIEDEMLKDKKQLSTDKDLLAIKKQLEAINNKLDENKK